MEQQLTVAREGGIPLEEWLTYVSRSQIIVLAPPRHGINPFTKKPCVFPPAAGAASFTAANGRCSIEYKSGELAVIAPDAEATRVVEEMAKALNAVVHKV